MKTTHFILAICLFASLDMPAQYSRAQLLANPNILWVGEKEVDFFLDELEYGNYFRLIPDWEPPESAHSEVKELAARSKELEQRGVQLPYWLYPLKYTAQISPLHLDGYHLDDKFSLASFLLDSLYWSATPLFVDGNLTNRYTQAALLDRILPLDTVIQLETDDAMEVREVRKIVRNLLGMSRLDGFRTKCLFYYDQKTNQFNVVVEAMAPLLRVRDRNGYFLRLEPLFWFGVQHQSTPMDLNAPQITWAKRSRWRVDARSIRPLKQTKDLWQCQQLQLDDLIANAKTAVVYDKFFIALGKEAGQGKRLSPDEIKKINTQRITRFDPETFQDQEVEVPAFEMDRFGYMEFATDWYWDNSKKQLRACPRWYAPILYGLQKKQPKGILLWPFYIKPLN